MLSRRNLLVGLLVLLAVSFGLVAGCGPTNPTSETTTGELGGAKEQNPIDPSSGARGVGDTPGAPEAPLGDGQRVVLVVGVQRYGDGTGLRNLDYPEADAADLAAARGRLGYKVTVLTRSEAIRQDKDFLRPTAKNIRDHLAAATKDRQLGDIVLVAFSGHGAHLKRTDRLYFCPSDTDLKVETSLVAIDEVMAALKPFDPSTMTGCKAGAKVVLFDACRSEPADGRTDETPPEMKSATRPLVAEPPGGTVALFSCSKGQAAYESSILKRGFLFHHVIEGLAGKAVSKKTGEVTWLGLAQYVTEELPDAVRKEKGPKVTQTPEVKGEIRGSLVLAKYHLAGTASLSPKVEVTKDNPKPGEVRKFEISDGVFMEFCYIPAGETQLGSSKAEQEYITKAILDGKPMDWLDDESEAKRGKFKTSGFWLGKYEVTQAEWKAVMDNNPSYFDGKKENEAKDMDTSASRWTPCPGTIARSSWRW